MRSEEPTVENNCAKDNVLLAWSERAKE